jgi:hypothetical protein
MLTSRFETEDTDVRITTYNGAKITTYSNIKQAMLDRRREKATTAASASKEPKRANASGRLPFTSARYRDGREELSLRVR